MRSAIFEMRASEAYCKLYFQSIFFNDLFPSSAIWAKYAEVVTEARSPLA